MTYTAGSLLRRLRLFHLHVFAEVLSNGSILAASKALHLSQPAVTKAIQDLEELLGQSLFIRTTQGVRPTEFGLKLEHHVENLITDVRHLVDDLNSWNLGVSGRIVVGTMLTASADFLPRAIMRLKDIAPNVVVEVKVGVNEKLYPELAKGEVDIVLGVLPTDTLSTTLEHTVLFEETLSAVAGRQNPLVTRVKENWFKDDSLSWLVPPAATATGKSVKHFFESMEIQTPLRMIESVSIMTNLGILMDSNYVALMPSTVARRFVQLGLVSLLPLKQMVPLGQIGYTLLKDRPVTPACQHFIEALSSVYR